MLGAGAGAAGRSWSRSRREPVGAGAAKTGRLRNTAYKSLWPSQNGSRLPDFVRSNYSKSLKELFRLFHNEIELFHNLTFKILQ